MSDILVDAIYKLLVAIMPLCLNYHKKCVFAENILVSHLNFPFLEHFISTFDFLKQFSIPQRFQKSVFHCNLYWSIITAYNEMKKITTVLKKAILFLRLKSNFTINNFMNKCKCLVNLIPYILP